VKETRVKQRTDPAQATEATDLETRIREALEAHPGAADDVLEILRPEFADRAALVRYWQTCRDSYARENRALIRERNLLRKEAVENTELTAREARDEVDRLGTELYRAQDAHAFVGEMCDLVEKKQKTGPGEAAVTTGEVREWLKGARCTRLMVVDASTVPPTRPEEDADRLMEALRVQVRAALEESGRSQASVARELLVSTKHLNQMLMGGAKLTLWWAARILRVCGRRLVVEGVER
jgi:hypothetical protein